MLNLSTQHIYDHIEGFLDFFQSNSKTRGSDFLGKSVVLLTPEKKKNFATIGYNNITLYHLNGDINCPMCDLNDFKIEFILLNRFD